MRNWGVGTLKLGSLGAPKCGVWEGKPQNLDLGTGEPQIRSWGIPKCGFWEGEVPKFEGGDPIMWI